MKLKEFIKNYAEKENIEIDEAEAKWALELLIDNLDENLANWVSDLMNDDTQPERPLINLLSKIAEIDNNKQEVIDACSLIIQMKDENIL